MSELPLGPIVSAISLTAGLAGLSIAAVAWRRRDHPAALPFSLMSISAGLWGIFFAPMPFLRDPFVVELLNAGIDLLGQGSILFFLWFSVVYTGYDDWITPWRKRVFLLIFGVLAIIIVLDPFLPLFSDSLTFETVAGLTLPVENRSPGPLLVIVSAFYATVLIGVALFMRFLISSRNVYRTQTAIIFVAILFGLLGNAIFEAGFSPHPGLDMTPIFYGIEATLIAFGLFHTEFLNVQPLAPDIVLQELEDPVLVLDDDATLLDFNAAAEGLFDTDTDPIGQQVDELLPGLLTVMDRESEFVTDGGSQILDGNRNDVYDVNETPIRDHYDRKRGSVVVMREITAQKRRQRTLEGLQSTSQEFLGAETPREVTQIAVDAAERVLGYPYSGVMLYDEAEDVFEPTALATPLFEAFTESAITEPSTVIERIDGEQTTRVPLLGRVENDIWTVFETERPVIGEPIDFGNDEQIPIEIGASMLFPLGDYGVIGISSGPDQQTFSEDDRRFGRILASTTENALDRVSKEQQLRESREMVEKRTEQIQFFNSVLRHDLLNGMMVVQGNAELLAEHVDDEAQDHVETIDDWTEDMTTLIQKVRTVTKTASGSADVETEPVELRSVVENKAEKIARSYEHASVETVLEREPRVLGDEMVPEIVENVLLNALEHNDQNSPEITVTTRRVEDSVRVRIADNGPGVPDDMKEAVFEEQVTSEDSGSIGFGLYFVSMMMDVYGGDVWFEDNDPRGAITVLEFPSASQDSTADSAADCGGATGPD